MKTVSMQDQGKKMLDRGSASDNIVAFGLVDWNKVDKSANGKGGRIAVYGDSNCIDSNNARGRSCFWLLEIFLKYTTEGQFGEKLKNMVMELKNDLLDKRAGAEPKRRPDSVRQFRKHSKVMLMENMESTVNIHERRKCNNK